MGCSRVIGGGGGGLCGLHQGVGGNCGGCTESLQGSAGEVYGGHAEGICVVGVGAGGGCGDHAVGCVEKE